MDRCRPESDSLLIRFWAAGKRQEGLRNEQSSCLDCAEITKAVDRGGTAQLTSPWRASLSTTEADCTPSEQRAMDPRTLHHRNSNRMDDNVRLAAIYKYMLWGSKWNTTVCERMRETKIKG